MLSDDVSPVNPPVYSTLKNLHLRTDLVLGKKPTVKIIVPVDGKYADQAATIQAAIKERTAVDVPIVTDDTDAGNVPFDGNIIVLGNRSTNAAISELYDRFFTLLDLRYPGPGGSVVRTLHNPLGDRHNVIFIGGSDDNGVTKAAESFCKTISELPMTGKNLRVGWMADITLGDAVVVPTDIREVETWEASANYKSIGYFGWTSISKHMALYYMTGNEEHAREFLRLAFPDEKARQDIFEIDDERIENKDDPLAGPYHYGAIMLILLWDLIEESPVFTDEQRLAVTHAFSRQLAHPQETIWREAMLSQWGQKNAFATPPNHLGDRHELWSYLSLYALSRYFARDYEHPLWQFCQDGTRWYYSALERGYWMEGLFCQYGWYSSSMAPIVTYMLLSGERDGVENGALGQLLLAQEILCNGEAKDPALASASIGFLHKAAYLTGDGRYLNYLQRTGMDLQPSAFRVGQSFWPEENLVAIPPTDRVNCWTLLLMPEGMWAHRASGVAKDQAFVLGSYRNTLDDSGDFLLFDTCKEQVYGPYHTFRLMALRINGRDVLNGTSNQTMVRMDGMMPRKFSLDAAVEATDVLGTSAMVQGRAEHAGYGAWGRTVLLRESSYALIVDQVTFSESCEQTEVETVWEGPGDFSILPHTQGIHSDHQDRPWNIQPCDDQNISIRADGCARTVWTGPSVKGDTITSFTLLAPSDASDEAPTDCCRLGDQAAVLTLPKAHAAVVVSEEYEGIIAKIIVLSDHEIHARGLRQIVLNNNAILTAQKAVDCYWDFINGVLEVNAECDTVLHLVIDHPCKLTLDQEPLMAETDKNGIATVMVPAGEHVIDGAKIPATLQTAIKHYLHQKTVDADAQQKNTQAASQCSVQTAEPLPIKACTDVGGPVTAMVTIALSGTSVIAAAEAERIHLWNPITSDRSVVEADAEIQQLHWWPEKHLLIAGCLDGQIIAFDPDSHERLWAVQSEMDPAVIRAGKPYWFNTSDRCRGIGGLFTGAFDPDAPEDTQLFAGGACTLEMFNGEGELLRRWPVFWGPPHAFAMIDGADGTKNLLVGRRPADTHAAVVINNRHPYVPNMLGPDPRSFHDVPPDQTDMYAWGRMSCNQILCDDINGDGRIEIISDITGAWNRITVWSDEAVPLWNANFGPGPGQRAGADTKTFTIQGTELIDLDGSGCKCIVTAMADGWVVALDHQCRKRWAHKLAGIPTALKTYGGGSSARLVVACADGNICVLEHQGNLTHTAQVNGTPMCMERCSQGVVIGTQTGTLVTLGME